MNEPRFTRPALWDDVLDLARRLNRQGARYVLVGGYALAGGHIAALFQPLELLMIGGAALGAIIGAIAGGGKGAAIGAGAGAAAR